MPRSRRARTPVEGVVHPTMKATLKLLEGRPGPPTEDDRPPISTFPGRPAKALPGQLELFELGAEQDKG